MQEWRYNVKDSKSARAEMTVRAEQHGTQLDEPT